MKEDKNLLSKIIFAIMLCVSVIEIGITVSFYMFTNMDYNKVGYNYEVVNK